MLEGVIQGVWASKPSMREPSATSRTISPQAFNDLFVSTYPSIVAILHRMLGDCGRAEELASEAFLRLHSTILPPAARENVSGWLYRTADFRARSRHIRLEREAALASKPNSHGENGLEILLREERQQRVRTVLAKLKPEWAQLLLLRATGHSYRELAEQLELAPGSIGTMLIRAEVAFERCYLELFGDKELEAL